MLLDECGSGLMSTLLSTERRSVIGIELTIANLSKCPCEGSDIRARSPKVDKEEVVCGDVGGDDVEMVGDEQEEEGKMAALLLAKKLRTLVQSLA